MSKTTFPKIYFLFLLTLLVSSCRVTKYVDDGKYLLDAVDIETDVPNINGTDLEVYLAQQPNFKVFGLTRLRLNTYNLSGRDTSKKRNRWIRSLGEPPVIYDEFQTKKSDKKLQDYFKARGYLNCTVRDSVVLKDKKAKVYFLVDEKEPYHVRNLSFDYHADTMLGNILRDYKFSTTKLSQGMLFDSDVLNEERSRLAQIARRRGYYYFNKDNISYLADSALGSHEVDLTLVLRPYYLKLPSGDLQETPHTRYTIRNVNFLTLKKSNSKAMPLEVYDKDTIKEGEFLYFEHKPVLREKVLDENLRIYPGLWYNESYVSRTYSKMSRLGIVRSTDISFTDLKNDEHQLDCNVVITPNKVHSFSLDVEGTNSAGDLGFAVTGGLQHRNLFRGGEVLALKARVAEEAVSSSSYKISDILSDHVLELDGEVSLTFPRFVFPFLSSSFRKKINASTKFTLAYDRQERPEYNRVISTAGVKYQWTQRRYYNYALDLFNLNYVNLPWISREFLNEYSDPKYSVLMYSYSNHFIVSSGFSLSFNNDANTRVKDKYAYKFSFESAGNLFYLLSRHGNWSMDSTGHYEFLDIPYSQYVKGEFEYSYNKYLDEKNNLVMHARVGLEVPYGNSETVPYEKRFFSGGANAVRGWSVRTLGPGSYSSPYSSDFVSQSGNIELTMNLEYRSDLFWRFKGAAFIDAGNIWNIRNYEFQPEGTFYLNEFYKQIALAYGLGLRCDFTYFLVRMDLGMKTYNPALSGSDKWRFHNITWSDDFAFHFAIGYPF